MLVSSVKAHSNNVFSLISSERKVIAQSFLELVLEPLGVMGVGHVELLGNFCSKFIFLHHKLYQNSPMEHSLGNSDLEFSTLGTMASNKVWKSGTSSSF